MSGLHNDWYVAGADGAAIGPLSRVEVAQRQARGARGERIGIGRGWQRATTVAWRGVSLGLPPLAAIAIIAVAGGLYLVTSDAWSRLALLLAQGVPG